MSKDKRPGNESNQRPDISFLFFFFSGGEERPENHLQVPRRLGLLRRTDLLEAAVTFSRHWAAAEVSLRHRGESAKCHQRSHGRDRAHGTSPAEPEPAQYGPGLHGRLPQLLQAIALLGGHRRPLLCQGHHLSESVLWAGLQHGHASHHHVLPLPGTLVLPRGVSNVSEGGGGLHLQGSVRRRRRTCKQQKTNPTTPNDHSPSTVYQRKTLKICISESRASETTCIKMDLVNVAVMVKPWTYTVTDASFGSS